MADDGAPEPTPKRRDKAALPFAEEDGEELDGRAWNRKPLVVVGVALAAIVVIVLLVLAGKSLTEGDDSGPVDVPPPVSSTTTTEATTTTTTTTTSTPPSTTEGGPVPGSACSPEEGLPDCVDPEGDGNYTIITNAGDCLETAEDPLECADNDGDGDAGPAVIPT